jgi:hypothetical protein
MVGLRARVQREGVETLASHSAIAIRIGVDAVL